MLLSCRTNGEDTRAEVVEETGPGPQACCSEVEDAGSEHYWSDDHEGWAPAAMIGAEASREWNQR